MKKAETETNIKWTDADGDAGFVKDATVDREAGHLYIKAYEDGTGDGVFLPLDAEKKLCKALNERRNERRKERRKERKAKKPRKAAEVQAFIESLIAEVLEGLNADAPELRKFVEAIANRTVRNYAIKKGFLGTCQQWSANGYEATARKVLECLGKPK